ncbi:spherulation-specific family 4 protein [Roseateles amylovorans]|uniref:Spherulation-specific family 4 protein n=1 Tax=Roseateles amylovorans TaxID=2978473 RepID=A0ABY6BA14_9BURK|nr:spherulation-specific family 4 protein [Roseateles amylovorans]UXH80751.1 spherulation-specific family 4 protein [Roseateles amylovorans]
MTRSTWITLAAAAAGFTASMAHAAPTNFALVAYWGETASTYGGQVPSGAYVVINPNSGALGLSASQITNWKAVIANIRAQGGKVLGYVATGYDANTADEQTRYNAITSELGAYKTTLGGVDGYFFDEAAFDDAALNDSQKCAGTPGKWANVRAKVAAAGTGGTLVWNAGWPGASGCFISSAQANEHVVMYEAAYSDYVNGASWLNGDVQNLANSLNVKTWLLVHSATQAQMQATLKGTTANYVYVTSMTYNPSLPWGGPIWNYTPTYWGNNTLSGSERWCLNSLKTGGSC